MKIVFCICLFIISWQSATCFNSLYQPAPSMHWEQLVDSENDFELNNENDLEINQAIKTEPTEEDDEHECYFEKQHFPVMTKVSTFTFVLWFNCKFYPLILQPPCNK